MAASYLSSTTTSPNVPSLALPASLAESRSANATSPPAVFLWRTTFVSSDVEVSDFVSDAAELGMAVQDIILMAGRAADGSYVVTSHQVLDVTDGASQLSVGTTIGLAV